MRIAGCQSGLWLSLALAGCGDDGPVRHVPDATLPDAPMCAPVTGAGTTHSTSVSTAQTWTAAESPHNVPGDISVTAALTIEPCAVVRIGDDHSIIVRQGGSLTAMGQAGLPVRFERLDSAASWATISVLGGGRLSFTYTDIDGGGDPLNTIPSLAGAVDVAGASPGAEGGRPVDNITISRSL